MNIYIRYGGKLRALKPSGYLLIRSGYSLAVFRATTIAHSATSTRREAGTRADMSAATGERRERGLTDATHQGSLTFARPRRNLIPVVARMQPPS